MAKKKRGTGRAALALSPHLMSRKSPHQIIIASHYSNFLKYAAAMTDANAFAVAPTRQETSPGVDAQPRVETSNKKKCKTEKHNNDRWKGCEPMAIELDVCVRSRPQKPATATTITRKTTSQIILLLCHALFEKFM